MRSKKIIISSLKKQNDGLGGYKDVYQDTIFYGKMVYSKDKMIITRANDLNTQKLANQLILYLHARFNNVSMLKKINRGDRVIEDGIEYKVQLVQAFKNMYVVTLLEEFTPKV